MECRCYLRKNIIYLPTLGKIEEGFYREIEPVAVVPISDIEKLSSAIEDMIRRGNPAVSSLPRANHPEPVILKYAGVKTWEAFARGTSTWSIQEKDGDYQIIGYKKGAGRGWSEDPDQTVTLPSGSGIDDVIDRLIATLQKAANE